MQKKAMVLFVILLFLLMLIAFFIEGKETITGNSVRMADAEIASQSGGSSADTLEEGTITVR